MPMATTLSRGIPALPRSVNEDLADLYRRDTPGNTLHAWESDLNRIATWRKLRFGEAMQWHERKAVALCQHLGHSRNPGEADPADPGPQAAEMLIEQKRRRSLARPAPATPDRQIGSWAFHRMRNLTSPFKAAVLRQARQKVRRARLLPGCMGRS
jgi:hypothetical protein